MCGRYNLHATPAELQGFFDLLRDQPVDWSPRYNIAPTQTVLAVRQVADHREAAHLRWGLIPFWAKDTKLAASMMNARSETLAEKPAFRAAFKRRRCLIPATGFYEWKLGHDKTKQPYHIHHAEHQLLAFAGLWERWDKGPEPIESCTIITTSANPLMQPLHDRMPVILSRDHWAAWLDPEAPPAALTELLCPYYGMDLTAERVSKLVNNARNESVDCIAQAES